MGRSGDAGAGHQLTTPKTMISSGLRDFRVGLTPFHKRKIAMKAMVLNSYGPDALFEFAEIPDPIEQRETLVFL